MFFVGKFKFSNISYNLWIIIYCKKPHKSPLQDKGQKIFLIQNIPEGITNMHRQFGASTSKSLVIYRIETDILLKIIYIYMRVCVCTI